MHIWQSLRMIFLLYFLGQCLADNCYPCQSRLTIYETAAKKLLGLLVFDHFTMYSSSHVLEMVTFFVTLGYLLS